MAFLGQGLLCVAVLWTCINLINDSSLLQERLKEIPTSVSTSSNGNFLAGVEEPLVSLPGSEFEHTLQPNIQVNIYRCLWVEEGSTFFITHL